MSDSEPRETISSSVTVAAAHQSESDACAHDPIHLIGTVQPAGAVLVFAADGACIAASENVTDLLDVASARACLGQAVADLLGEGAAKSCQAAPHDRARIPNAGPAGTALHVHRNIDELTILEIERDAASTAEAINTHAVLGAGLEAIYAAVDTSAVLDAAVATLATLTGCERVIALQFLADGTGDVVAEHVAGAGMDSYLGLRYPAGDIPSQTRQLYARYPLRVVFDAQAEPVRIQTDQPDPIDIGGAVFRSVASVHTAYLANMGVRSSLSVSLPRRGVLWGMLIAHCRTPQHPAPSVRDACAVLGRVVTSRTRELEADSDGVRIAEVREVLLDTAITAADPARAMLCSTPGLDAYLPCDSAAILEGDRVLTTRNAPSTDAVRAMAEKALATGATVFHTDRLTPIVPNTGEVAGVLAAVIDRELPAVMMWFRSERVQPVRWAGRPDQTKTMDLDGTVQPRESFGEWTQLMQGQSDPWQPWELHAAEHLRMSLIDRRVLTAQAVHERSSIAPGDLTVIVHELRAPLRNLVFYTSELVPLIPPEPDPRAETVASISRLARRAQSTLDAITDLAAAETRPLETVSCSLDRTVAAAIAELRELRPERAVEATIVGKLGRVTADSRALARVLSVLLSNAAAYNDAETVELRIERCVQPHDELIIADNGIGLTAATRRKLFRPLERPGGSERYGPGSGVGLSVARQFMRRHGGDVTLEPGSNGGAVARVQFRRTSQKTSSPSEGLTA